MRKPRHELLWPLVYIHLGLLIGFGVMILLARYEEDIAV